MNTHRTNRSRAVRVVALATATATVGLGFFAAPALARKPRPVPSSHTVVATGLNNPRGIATEGDRLVYVSEAGTGGTECFQANSGAEETCLGLTGSITRFEKLGKKKQRSTKVVDGLLSIENTKTGEVVGIDGITLKGDHDLQGIMAESAAGLHEEFLGADGGAWTPPTLADAVTNYAGRLVRFKRKHGTYTPTVLANIGQTNWDWSNANKNESFAPAGQFPDSNPYAVLAQGDRTWVVDAGSNTVTEVRKKHGVYTQTLLAYIPNPLAGSDAAPTCVAKRGRYLYVGELNFAAFYGTPFTAAATVYRIDTRAKNPQTAAEVWATGFSPITGCGFAKDSFYVVQLRTASSSGANGAITRVAINEDGTAGTRNTFGEDLVDPSGFAKYHNTILVANKSTSKATGEIWQFKI